MPTPRGAIPVCVDTFESQGDGRGDNTGGGGGGGREGGGGGGRGICTCNLVEIT